MFRLRLLLLAVISCQAYAAENKEKIKPKQLVLAPENQYSAGVYDFNFLHPQQPSPQVPQYHFSDPRNAMPRYQPQFLFYGGAPGQPFLVNQGPPPNNFLYPQPGPPQGPPGVIYRNGPPLPQGQPRPQQPGMPPFFAGGPPQQGGFPNQKPAFVPPIEKDAEEVSTNPARIPPFKPKKPVEKPEKLETFNDTPTATEDDGLQENQKPQAQPKIPRIVPDNSKPDHRYFVLNGQPLFNYPFSLYQPQNINPDDVLKYSQNFPGTRPQEVPVPVIPALQDPSVHNPQLHNPNFAYPGLQQPQFQNPAVFDGLRPDLNRGNGFPLNYDPFYHGGFPHTQQDQPQVPNVPNYLQNVPVNPGFLGNRFNTEESQNIPKQDSHQTPVASTPEGHLYVSKVQPETTLLEDRKNTVTKSVNAQSSLNAQPHPQTGVFRSVLPFSVIPKEGQNVQIRVSNKDFNLTPLRYGDRTNYQAHPEEAQNDAVVIEAKYDDEHKDTEAVSTPAKQPLEPSLAQAGPSAVSLAGPGGVAAAGPKATAFVGKEGMAISSPKATAIAGPAEEESDGDEEDSKKDANKEIKVANFRQRFRSRYQ